jgi:hypothetical protein
VSTGPTACIYVATCTRPTVRHVYSDRTRGELQVAKNNFFCSESMQICVNYEVKEQNRRFLWASSSRLCMKNLNVCSYEFGVIKKLECLFVLFV